MAIAGALPLVWFVSRSLTGELPRLLVDDPCFAWGQSSGISVTVGIAPCEHSAGGTSETKASAITRLIVVQGGMLLSTAFAVLGSYSGRRRLCGVAFVMTLVISFPLMLSGLGLLTLFSAGCFLLSCLYCEVRAGNSPS